MAKKDDDKRVPRKGIDELFYETRTRMGRAFTGQRFAREVLGGSVENVMLGYIEKGQRFPSESLVRRLAAIRGDDPRALLAALARDKLVATLAKEIRKTASAPKAVGGVDDAEIAVRVSQAIAALPDDGSWITLARWRKEFRAPPSRQKNKEPLAEARAAEVERLLEDKGLIEKQGRRVRRKARHYAATDAEERVALAVEYCVLFLTGLLDSIALDDPADGTYMRNHYLNIDADRIPEFKQRLDDALRGLAREFAADKSAKTKFFNVLATGVSLEGDDE